MMKGRPQAGFSMVEILLVIGIIAAISIGAFIIYPRVKLSQEVKDTSSKVVMVSAATQQFFGDRPYTGLTNASAISAGIVEDADLLTPWGQMNINATTSGDGFRVDLTGLSIEACQRLVSDLETSASSLRVGSTFVKDPEGTPPVAYDVYTATSTCVDGSNTLSIWPYNS